MLSINKYNISYFLWPPLFILAFVFGEYAAGDFLSYKLDYDEHFISDPFYILLRNIFGLLGLPYIVFYGFLTFLVSYSIITLAKRYRISLVLSVFLIIYASGYFWVGHLRASLSLFFFATLLSLNGWVVILSAGLHSGNLINFVSYLMLRRWIVSLIIVVFGFTIFYYYADSIVYYISELLMLVGRDRFVRVWFLERTMHFEHRSLFFLENVKLWYVVLNICICSIFSFRTNSQRMFVLIPSLSYLLFSFDAYLAQKSYLNLEMLIPIGYSGLLSSFFRNLMVFVWVGIAFGNLTSRWGYM